MESFTSSLGQWAIVFWLGALAGWLVSARWPRTPHMDRVAEVLEAWGIDGRTADMQAEIYCGVADLLRREPPVLPGRQPARRRGSRRQPARRRGVSRRSLLFLLALGVGALAALAPYLTHAQTSRVPGCQRIIEVGTFDRATETWPVSCNDGAYTFIPVLSGGDGVPTPGYVQLQASRRGDGRMSYFVIDADNDRFAVRVGG